jgi:hypothetical protein
MQNQFDKWTDTFLFNVDTFCLTSITPNIQRLIAPWVVAANQLTRIVVKAAPRTFFYSQAAS